MESYDSMVALWSEFDPTIVHVRDVDGDKAFAGVQVPEPQNYRLRSTTFQPYDDPLMVYGGDSADQGYGIHWY